MAWKVQVTDEAKKDYTKFEGSLRKQVLAEKNIKQIFQNKLTKSLF